MHERVVNMWASPYESVGVGDMNFKSTRMDNSKAQAWTIVECATVLDSFKLESQLRQWVVWEMAPGIVTVIR